MRYNLILNVLGLIAKYTAVLFILPILACVVLKENSQIMPYVLSGAMTYLIGIIFSFNKVPQNDIDNVKKS